MVDTPLYMNEMTSQIAKAGAQMQKHDKQMQYGEVLNN